MEDFGEEIAGGADEFSGNRSLSRHSKRRQHRERQGERSVLVGGERSGGNRVEVRKVHSRQGGKFLQGRRHHQEHSSATAAERRRRPLEAVDSNPPSSRGGVINDEQEKLMRSSSQQEKRSPLDLPPPRKSARSTTNNKNNKSSHWENDLDAIGLLASTVRDFRHGRTHDNAAHTTTTQVNDSNGRPEAVPSRRRPRSNRTRSNPPKSHLEPSSQNAAGADPGTTGNNARRLVIDAMPLGEKWRSSLNTSNTSTSDNPTGQVEMDNSNLQPPSTAVAAAARRPSMAELSPRIPKSSTTNTTTHQLSPVLHDNILRECAQGVKDSLANLVKTLDALADAAQDEQIPSSVPRAILRQVPSLETALTRIRPVLSKILDIDSPSSVSGQSMPDGTPLAVVSAAYFDRIARLVDMLSQTVQAATQLKIWNRNSDASYATALELLDRACVELRCIRDLRRDPSDIPWRPSSRLRGAWTRSGHRDKLRLLLGQDEDASTRSGAGTGASASTGSKSTFGASASGASGSNNGFDSRAGPADPELFREVSVEVILQSLQCAPNDIGEIHRACSGVDCSEVVSDDDAAGMANDDHHVPGVGDDFHAIPGLSLFNSSQSSSSVSATNGAMSPTRSNKDEITNNTPRSRRNADFTDFTEMVPVPVEAERLLYKIKRSPLPRDNILNEIVRQFIPNIGTSSPRERNRRDEVSSLLEMADSSQNLSCEEQAKTPGAPLRAVCIASAVEEDAATSRRASQYGKDLSFFFDEHNGSNGNSVHNPSSRGVGMTGLGKTTIAAMLVSRRDIRSHFSGGIAWLDIGRISCMTPPNENLGFMRSGVSFDFYIDCLRSIRDQLRWDKTSNLAEQVLQLSTDADIHERQVIECSAMTQSKMAMTCLFRKFAERRQGPVLLVLDDVKGEDDLRWFQFVDDDDDAQSEGKRPPVELLVTTRLRNLTGVTHTVKIDKLDEDESLELLSRESGQYPEDGSPTEGSHPKNSDEARMIVSECGGHPLIVRSVARWCRLKQYTAGHRRAMQEVYEEVTSCIEEDDGDGSFIHYGKSWNHSPSMQLLFKIGNRTLSPVMQGEPTQVIKLCFAALTKVFFHSPNQKTSDSSSGITSSSSRPVRVPLETATLLWMELIRLDAEDLFPGVDSTSGESMTTHERRKHQVSLISEALGSLGVINIIEDTGISIPNNNNITATTNSKKYIEIHHDALKDYGNYLSTKSGGLLGRLVQDADCRWNKCFVTACLAAAASGGSIRDGAMNWDDSFSFTRPSSRRGGGSSSSSVVATSASWLACREYALHMLVSHMIRADMLREAKSLLKEDRFVRSRLRHIGWEEGTKRHVEDCEEVCRLIRTATIGTHEDTREDSVSNQAQLEVRSTMVLSYAKVTSLLCAEARAVDRGVGVGGAVVNGANTPSVEAGQALRRIGASLSKHQCWAQAVNHYKRSLEFLQVSLPDNHGVVASMLYDVSTVRLEVHDHFACVQDLGQSLTIRERIFGPDHPIFLTTVHRMGVLLMGICKYAPAMDCFERVISAMMANSRPNKILLGDALLHKGCLQLKRGETGLAIVSFDAAIRAKKAELGENHPTLARIYFHAGKAFAVREDNESAIERLSQAKRLLREPKSITAEERDIEESMLWLIIEGTLSNLEGRHDRSTECFQDALRVHKRKESGRKGIEARLNHMLACTAVSAGDNRKAMARFEDSLKCRTTRTSRSDLDVADTLFEMGCIHLEVGKYEKSRRCLDESLRIRKLQLGDSHIVAETLARLGDLHKTADNNEDADSCYDEALRVRERLFGEDHESVASALHERASQKSAMNDFGEALAFFEESLELRKKLRGDNHPDVADTYYGMGGTLVKIREYDRAFECLSEALRIRRANFGKDHPTVGDVLNRLGYLQFKFENHQVALQFLWEALRIRKDSNVPVKVADSLNHMGMVHMAREQYALAHECYEESLRILRSELGDTHKKVADAYIAIGDVQSAFGEHKDACGLYRKGLNILRVHGNKYDQVAPVLQELGVLELKAGNLDNSMNYLQEFIVLRKESASEPDVDYVNALHIVGKIHRMKGEDAEAGRVWAEAYTIYKEKNMMSDHPSIGDTLQGLLRGMYNESRNYENSFFQRWSDRWSGSLQSMADELQGGGSSEMMKREESGTCNYQTTSERSIADIANFMDDVPPQPPTSPTPGGMNA